MQRGFSGQMGCVNLLMCSGFASSSTCMEYLHMGSSYSDAWSTSTGLLLHSLHLYLCFYSFYFFTLCSQVSHHWEKKSLNCIYTTLYIQTVLKVLECGHLLCLFIVHILCGCLYVLLLSVWAQFYCHLDFKKCLCVHFSLKTETFGKDDDTYVSLPYFFLSAPICVVPWLIKPLTHPLEKSIVDLI